jgi:hypothetical protein
MSRTIRSMVLALTLLALCSSATYALPLGSRLEQEDFLTSLWDRLAAWISPGHPVGQESGGSWTEKEGSQMDPNGLPSTSQMLAVPGEEGSSMDPNGNK